MSTLFVNNVPPWVFIYKWQFYTNLHKRSSALYHMVTNNKVSQNYRSCEISFSLHKVCLLEISTDLLYSWWVLQHNRFETVDYKDTNQDWFNSFL